MGNANKPFNFAPLPAGNWAPAGGNGLVQYDASNDLWAVYAGRGNYDITKAPPSGAQIPSIVPNQGFIGQVGEALSNGWGAAVSLVFGGAALGGALGGTEAAPLTAPAASSTTGASAVYVDPWEGLYSAPAEMDVVYGTSGIESAPAELAASAQASTLMPPAIPELDPTFGGTLVESSPGVYTPAQPSNVLGTLASATDTAAKAAGVYRTVRGLLSSPKHADVSPTASAPWKNPLGGANNDTRDVNDMLKSNAIGAGFIFIIVAAILFALFFRR